MIPRTLPVEYRPFWRTTFGMQLSRTLFLRLPLVLFAAFMLFPIYWLARTSLMNENQLIELPLRFLPWPITLFNYVAAFQEINLLLALGNSLIIAGLTCIFSLALVMLSAYAISRFRFRGKGMLFLLLLGTQMLPNVMILVPIFVVLRTFGLLDSYAGVVLAELLGTIPFTAVLLTQFFDQINHEIDEAAMLDGCNRVQVLFLIVAPLILPGLVTVTIYNFIGVWNSLILPVVLISDPNMFTLPIALMLLQARTTAIWGMQAAGGMLNLIPSLILFGMIERYLISGLSSGAVKG